LALIRRNVDQCTFDACVSMKWKTIIVWKHFGHLSNINWCILKLQFFSSNIFIIRMKSKQKRVAIHVPYPFGTMLMRVW